MAKFNNNFDKYFSVYLLFILASSIFLINNNYLLDTNNSIAEWVINYQGGFGRRGLIGELFLLISSITGIYLKNVILYFLVIIFVLYYLLIYLFFINLNLNKIFIIAIYSPLFIIFPIAELEGLGRKDVIIPFSTGSYLSCDGTGNFFRLDLNAFQPERHYRFLYKVVSGSGNTRVEHIIDNDHIFKITR